MFTYLPGLEPETLFARLGEKKEMCIVDLRSTAQYRSGHIQGSLSLPGRVTAEGIRASLGPAAGRTAPLCLVSTHGKKAEGVAMRLRRSGLDQVYVLAGGITGWRQAGLPLRHHKRRFALQQQLNLMAGAALLVLLAKAVLLHPVFYVLSAAVGVGLIAAGLARRTGLRRVLLALPWNRRGTAHNAATGDVSA